MTCFMYIKIDNTVFIAIHAIRFIGSMEIMKINIIIYIHVRVETCRRMRISR